LPAISRSERRGVPQQPALAEIVDVDVQTAGDVHTPPIPLRPRQILHERLGAFVDVGFSKLVLVPLAEPADWHHELDRVGGAVLELQT